MLSPRTATRIAHVLSCACILLASFFLLSLTRCVSDADTPTFSNGDGGADASGPFTVSGTVSGLPAGGTVTLGLNGGAPISTGDGPFSFPNELHPGDPYTVLASAVTQGYSCAVMNGAGVVAAANIAVVVNCASANATLSALSISTGTLAPAFSQATLAYAADIRVSALFPPPTTITVTATTADAKATIAIGGAKVASGSPSAPIALKSGPTAIDVTVTAPDGTTQQHYAIAINGVASDYLKASNTRTNAKFGASIALSSDGTTLAVGSPGESSSTTGLNGDETDTNAASAGAVYVFVKSGATWTQQAYVKPSNTGLNWDFGASVALSADGNTLAAAATGDSSCGVGVNASQAASGCFGSGAVFVFTRAATAWSQEVYIKGSNSSTNIGFGGSLALSSDGNTLAVGAAQDCTSATGINSPPQMCDGNYYYAGSAYVLARVGTTWSEQAYIKSSNTRANAYFGQAVAISGDGSTVAVGSPGEASNAKGIGGDQTSTAAQGSGAVYMYTRAGATWSQQIYIKASNTSTVPASFGASVGLSSDGNTLAVGASHEASASTNQADISTPGAGAIYVFTRALTTWSQQAYVKASVIEAGALVGGALSISTDGNTILVGAIGDQSAATGVGGNANDTSVIKAGAAYLFVRTGTTWAQSAYLKSSNTRANELFAQSVALSADGKHVAAGAIGDASKATGVNGDAQDATASGAGAAFAF